MVCPGRAPASPATYGDVAHRLHPRPRAPGGGQERGWQETCNLGRRYVGARVTRALDQVVQLDIDVEGQHPVKGLLLAAWIGRYTAEPDPQTPDSGPLGR